jgi:tricorn protease
VLVGLCQAEMSAANQHQGVAMSFHLPQRIVLTLIAAVFGATVPLSVADVQPHAGMLRNPDVSATHIVFVYANDLWVVPRAGGMATPLASPPGVESFPRFSPDGPTIAFVGNYDGNADLYTISLTGGVPYRVTHHPNGETLCDWTPDGRLLFFSNFLAPMARQMQLFTVAAEGGLPERLPVPYGANGAISPDGQWLTYTPHTTDNRTWKRYRGGMATDIWLFNLRDHSSKKITDWEGTDSQPMWHGDKIYYMSDDGPSHRLNIWVYDTKTGQREQITTYSEYDIKWPAIGPGPSGQGEIVFQNGPDLCLLDLGTRQTRVVEVTIPGDRPMLRPQRVDANHFIQSWDLSPTGKRAVVQARGDIWTIPAHKGSPRNLTRTSGIAEREPAWSPDGKWIAYFSDETGEYELYVRPADVVTEPRKDSSTAEESDTPRKLSDHGPGFLYSPNWSPDSKYIVYSDNAGDLFLRPLEGDETTRIDTDPWAFRPEVSWSHDSKWLAYTRATEGGMPTIWLYRVDSGEKQQVTSEHFASSLPTFDRKGEYFFFVTNRRFDDPHYGDVDGTWIYVDTDMICVVPLRTKVALPWTPKSDEESVEPSKPDKEKEDKKEEQEKDERPPDAEAGQAATQPAGSGEEPAETPQTQEAESKPAEGEEAKKEEKKAETKPLEIDLAGFEQRAMALPIKAGAFHGLAVNDGGQLIYLRAASRGAEGAPSIMILDLTDEEKKEKTVLSGAGWLGLSADGKKLLVHKDGSSTPRPTRRSRKPCRSTAWRSRSARARNGSSSSPKSGASSATSSTWRTCTASTGRRCATSMRPCWPIASAATT